MRKDPIKIPEQKKEPKASLGFVIIFWLIFIFLVALDIYGHISGVNPIDAVEILCDLGVLAVAVYFNVKYIKDKKKNSDKNERS